MNIGLYLAGAGSLDGSDPFTTVLTYERLQRRGWTPVPVGRDISQGKVLNHRFAYEQGEERNSLTESARLVRGNIEDCRDVDTEDLDGAVLVGGGGVLTTWTDYDERGSDCRITERLKFHLMEFHQQSKPVLALDNASIAVAVAFREQEIQPTLNPGTNSEYRSLLESMGATVGDESPCWDRPNRLGSLPDLTGVTDLTELGESLDVALEQFERLLDESNPENS